MSLSQEQKNDLNELGRQLRRIEEFAILNNIDLDVYMTQYGKKGIAVYGTEKVALNTGTAKKRKEVFQRSEKPHVSVKTRSK
jgi:hypothetical protein